MSTCRKEGFCVAPRTEKEIRASAEQLRKVLLPRNDIKYLDVARVLELKIPEIFPGFRYEIVCPDEMPDREAEMNPSEFCIRIQEPVYTKALAGDGHCRFTLAHEFGHFFLHRAQTLAFGRKAENGNIPTYMNSEWQADVFARNLLAPLSLARGMTANEIEVLFGVSRSVANIITGMGNAPIPILQKHKDMIQTTFDFS